MARFYRTASSNPMDYMRRMNIPLMAEVLKTNDQFITDNLGQLATLGNAATSFPYLQADEARAKAISEGYNTQINDLTEAIRKDPANWKRQLDPIRNISKELQANFKSGEISKIAGNYGVYKQASDYIDEQTKAFNKDGKGISADRAKAYKTKYLNDFLSKNPNGTSYNAQTGEYNMMSAANPMNNMDINKVLGDELEKLKADKTSYKKDEVTGDEWYFNKKTQTWEGVSPEKILGIVTDRLNNPQLMNYLKQDSDAGIIKGVFDSNGKMIAPYRYRGVEISPEEKANVDAIKAQISRVKDPNMKAQLESQLGAYNNKLNSRKSLEWNPNSYLSPILQGLASQYSYGQTEEGDELRNNSKGSTRFTQAQTNMRQARQLQQQSSLAAMREKGINDRFDTKLAFDKYKWDNPHEKAGAAKTAASAKGTKKGVEPVATESTVSRLQTNSFEDWTTQDPNGQSVKVLSNAGLSSDIDALKKQESTALSQVNSIGKQMDSILGNRSVHDLSPNELNVYNNLKVQKQGIQGSLPKIQSDLNARRKWYEGSIEAALTNNPNAKKDNDGNYSEDLTPQEVALYKKFSGDRSGQNTRAAMTQLEKDAEASFLRTRDNDSLTPEQRQIAWGKHVEKYGDVYKKVKLTSRELQEYSKVKAKVDQRRENFLAQLRYTPIDTDAIQVGSEDSKAITNLLFNNPQGVKLYDNTGNRTDYLDLEGKGISWFDPKGDNYKMTTADKSIINYMLKNDVTPTVEQVGNTTKIGNGGAVVKLTFKDPTGQIPTTPFYAEVTPELQKAIGTRINATTKNADVKKIADALLDDEANDIRRQLITPTIAMTAGASDKYDPVTNIVQISAGNVKIPFQVTKFVGSDGKQHLSVTRGVSGVQVPLGADDPAFMPKSGIPGWFNGAEDFIEYIKLQKQK